MSAEPGSFGSAIHILRTSRRITIKGLEDATRIWRPTLIAYEKGRQQVPYLDLAKLVRAMGLRIRAVDLAQAFDLGLEETKIGEGVR